jgi:EF-P beta-lysylation protein EpmB
MTPESALESAPESTPGVPTAGPEAIPGGEGRDRGPGPRERWQTELAAAVRDPGELCRLLGLDAAVAAAARRAAGGFPLLVPRPFLERMKLGDPHDPLLRQVLPLGAELASPPGWVADPLEEAAALAAPGLVKKYDGRALLLATGACAVHCRYCFRREFPYADHGASSAGTAAALRAIAADPSIREVVLSGGDPLLLDDDRIADLLGRIVAIPTVTRIRIHTRLPVVLPSRVTRRLVDLLAALSAPAVVVIHANHPAELGPDQAAAVRDLASSRAILLNQAVLLAGVNDTLPVLLGLSERLLAIGVLPYYLHLPDRVVGTAHFDVPEAKAVGLIDALRQKLSGYGVPRLVREVPGEASKVSIA